MPQSKRGFCFPLRLPLSMRAELATRADFEGISINQFIVLAVAEKIVKLETQPFPDGNRNPSEHFPAEATEPAVILDRLDLDLLG